MDDGDVERRRASHAVYLAIYANAAARRGLAQQAAARMAATRERRRQWQHEG